MYEEVKELLINNMHIKPEAIKPEAELAKDLGINSLELADFIILCEEKFDIEVQDDIHEFITVNDIVTYFEEKSCKIIFGRNRRLLLCTKQSKNY